MKAISRFSKSLALAAPVVAMSADQAEAAAYIKFDGIDGEAQSENFKGYVKIDFFKVEIEGVTAGEAAKVTDFKVTLPMEKASPATVAEAITTALKNGTEDVFPDPTSAQMQEGWKADAKGMERQMAQMASA